MHVVTDFCFTYSLKEGTSEKHQVTLAEKHSD
jgi:hypothetical protein